MLRFLSMELFLLHELFRGNFRNSQLAKNYRESFGMDNKLTHFELEWIFMHPGSKREHRGVRAMRRNIRSRKDRQHLI
jgi:hypothetical protein